MPIRPGKARPPARSRSRTPLNRKDMPVVIRVQSAAGELIPHIEVSRAIGFIKAKARQLTPIMWREAARRRNNLPNRTFYYAMPGSTISAIELKTNPREQSWHARIIGGSIPAGILAFPRNVDNPTGWKAPFDIPPGSFLGVPNVSPTVDEKRGVFRLQGTTLTYIPDQDFRLFESDHLIDWRSFQIPNPDVPGGRDFELLHFHNYSRYFPPHKDKGIDVTGDVLQSFFYDKTGTVKVTGPGGFILGVALRFLDDDTKPTEYICAVGLFPGDDLEFFARDRDDILDPWRLIGSIPAAFYDTQLDNGVFGAEFYTFNVTPFNFNRRGTRACKMIYSGQAATDGDAVPYLFEIIVNDESIEHSLVRQDTPYNTSSRAFNFDSVDQTGPNTPPDCPEVGDVTTTIVTTTNRGDESDTAQLACPIAVDYKIGSDDELGSITMDNVVSAETSQSGTNTSVDITNGVCLPGGTGTAREETINGVLDDVERRDRSVTFRMDGGQAAFTMGPFGITANDFGLSGVNSSIVRTITTNITVEYTFPDLVNPSNTISSVVQTVALTRSPNETKIPSNQAVEIAAADIRYGSMIVKERSIVLEDINVNATAQEYEAPAQTPVEPTQIGPQVVGPVEEPSGATNVITPLSVFTFPDKPAFAVWGSRNIGTVRTTVKAQGIDEVFTATDPLFYALQLFSPSGNQRPFIVAGDIPFSGSTVPSPPGEVLNSSSDPTPGLVGFASTAGANEAFVMPRTQTTNAVHDRNGKYFFNIEVPANDGIIHFTIGPVVQFTPIFDFTSFSAYQNLDPTIPVGMPLNEALGAQVTLANTTRPLFFALVAVQNEQIPGETEDP